MFRFDRLPENMSTMDARSVRTELSKIRDVTNVISADMARFWTRTASRLNAETRRDKEMATQRKKVLTLDEFGDVLW